MAEWIWLEHLSLRPALALVVLRTLPFAVHLCLGRGTLAALRITAASSWLGLAALLGFDRDLGWVVTIMAYYTLASAGVFVLARAYRSGWFSAGAVFVACALGFVLLPGLLMPRRGDIIALVVGWELMLAAHSYCLDASESKERQSLQDCVFFLMVSPMLVFPDWGRHQRSAGLSWRGASCAAAGLLGLSVSICALRPLLHIVDTWRVGSTGAVALFWSAVGFGILRFMTAYFLQAGEVNLRIGLMRCLGYQVPDAFHYPFLASSPIDFWRRWNVYVLSWLYRYIYGPITESRHVLRLGTLGIALAVVATFLVSGLLHDLHSYVQALQWVGRFTMQFAMVGLGVLVWLLVDRGLKLLARRSPKRFSTMLRGLRALTARLVVITALFTMPFIWG